MRNIEKVDNDEGSSQEELRVLLSAKSSQSGPSAEAERLGSLGRVQEV